MANFKEAYELTAINEGGYANDKTDSGGETFKGVARNFFPKWSGWIIIDEYKKEPNFPQSLNSDQALQHSVEVFYKANFWDKIRGDEIVEQGIANTIYDSAVNMGVSAAIKMAQQALFLTPSGKMDGATLNKLNNKA